MRDSIETLRQYNRWRRGADIPQPKPVEIGEAIDAAIEEIRTLREANAALVLWKGEITSRRIAMGLPFPDDYDESPKYAMHSLVEAEVLSERDACRDACMSVNADAEYAAKAKDATTYKDGYQDAAIDCDEAIRMRSVLKVEQ